MYLHRVHRESLLFFLCVPLCSLWFFKPFRKIIKSLASFISIFSGIHVSLSIHISISSNMLSGTCLEFNCSCETPTPKVILTFSAKLDIFYVTILEQFDVCHIKLIRRISVMLSYYSELPPSLSTAIRRGRNLLLHSDKRKGFSKTNTYYR